MTQRQHEKLTMLVLMADMVTDPNSEMQLRMPQLAENLITVSLLIPLIDAAGAEQQLHNYSAKGSKTISKTTLCSGAMRGIRAIEALAETTDQADLAEQFNFNESTLKKMKDHSLLEIASNVHAFALVNEAALIPFHCTKADTAALGEALEFYRESAWAPSKNDLARKAASRRLRELFRQAEALLKKCDVLVKTLIGVADDLHAEYKERRVIRYAVNRHNRVIGKVTDSAGNPLEKVVVTIEGLSYRTETTSTGGFRFMSLPDGVHILRFSRPGYEDLLHTIAVTHGLRSNAIIEMREI